MGFLVRFCKSAFVILFFSVVCSVITKLIVFPNRLMGVYSYPSAQKLVQSRCGIFCNGVILSSNRGTQFTAYLYHSMPARGKYIDYSTEVGAYLSMGNYQKWIYYLNSNSVVNIDLRSQFGVSQTVNVFLIKGDEDFNSWISSPLNEQDVFYVEKKTCEFYPIRPLCLVRLDSFESDDNYFIIIRPTTSDVVFMHTKIEIVRQLYSTKNYNYACNSSNLGHCHFDLLFEPLNVIGIQAISTDTQTSTSVSVIWEARIWMYVIVFGLLPVLCLFVTMTVVECCKRIIRMVRDRRDSGDSQEATAAENIEEPPPYTNDTERDPLIERPLPPAYDEVITSDVNGYNSINNDPPPPYNTSHQQA